MEEWEVNDTTMSAVTASGYGGVEMLSIQEVPTASPEGDQLLVSVEGSSLNALDWHFLTGTPYLVRLMNGVRTPKRKIPGADVAGVVVAVGPDSSEFAVGDRVFGECAGGGCAPFVTVRASSVAAIPEGVSFEAAGVTPVAGITALQGLVTHGAVQPGERVLVNGAAGGVGTFAVQIAKALGAEVTAVCSTRNVDAVAALGADEVVDYTSTDVVDGVARFDVIFDGVGNRSGRELASVARSGARVVVVSGPKTNRWLGPIPHLVRTWWALRRADATFHQFTASPNRDDLSTLGEMLAAGSVVPAIDRTVGLDGVADAMVEIGSGHARAKIAVRIERANSQPQ